MPVSVVNSKVEICNLALGLVGDMRIDSFEDTGSLNARLCRDYYDQVRDLLLRSANWNFAIKRATLAREATSPLFSEDYQYRLPSDYIKMISLNEVVPDGGVSKFRIEILNEYQVILTDDDAANIRYIFRNDTPALYSARFIEAFSYALASKISFPIAGEPQLTGALEQMADRKLSAAMRENENESDVPVKQLTTLSPLVARRRNSPIG